MRITDRGSRTGKASPKMGPNRVPRRDGTAATRHPARGRNRPGPMSKSTIRHDKPDAQARWSRRVTRDSNALDLDPGVFTWRDPKAIARSLKRSAEASRRRKSPPFRSAMSMLSFYVNRAGSTLSAEQRDRLDAAKDELRVLFDRPRRQARR